MDHSERRQHHRYDTEAKVYFRINYDLVTKVTYQIFDKIKKMFVNRKYMGLTRNVSCSGLGFVCDRKLNTGDLLKLDVYLPGIADPVSMDAEVRWCHENKNYPDANFKDEIGRFEVGVKLQKVNGQPIAETVHFDNTYQVEWSIALESLLGNYRIFAQKNQKSQE
jgi:hypothetical protein